MINFLILNQDQSRYFVQSIYCFLGVHCDGEEKEAWNYLPIVNTGGRRSTVLDTYPPTY